MITNSAAATNNSCEAVEATSRNSGRNSRRPTITIATTASVAFTIANTEMVMIEPSERLPMMETSSSIGITARSCASRTAKLVRPAVVASRPWLESTSITIAVEDKARHAPRMIDTVGGLPNRLAMPPITAVVRMICRLPSPNTRRRMVFRRSKDSSMPIMNSRNTTPSSAMPATFLASTTVTQYRNGNCLISEPSPSGPSIAPAAR